MPKILVVDDAPVDRRLVTGILEKQSDLQSAEASNGVDALDQMASVSPDLVVTDLMMPEMDGLQLVDEVRRKFPFVPVILMTSKGSEEVAVEALRRGAATYVPKKTLGRDLVETIRSLLAVSGEKRTFERLMDSMTRSDLAFEIENDMTLVPLLVSYMQDQVTRIGICPEAERIRVGVALEEALTNALHHGNLEVGSELRESDYDAYMSLLKERSGQPPYCDRRIHVEANLSSTEANFVIRDEGPGFDPESLPDPTDPANIDKVSGRGILLMRTFMDDVAFSDRGNEVTMRKFRVSDEAEPATE